MNDKNQEQKIEDLIAFLDGRMGNGGGAVKPKFEDGKVVEDGRMTVIFNGVCVHNNIVLKSNTPGGVTEYRVEEGPLMLQDHGNRVRFRNVWIEKLN